MWEQSNHRTCPSKKTFLTWKQATTHNNMMLKPGSPAKAKGIKIEKLHVYKCKRCGLFHIGHPPKKHRLL